MTRNNLIYVFGAPLLALNLCPFGNGAVSVVCLVLLAVMCSVIVERDTTSGRSQRPEAPLGITSEASRADGVSRVLIVGAGYVGRSLAENLEMSGKYEVVGFLDDPEDVEPDDRWRILGGRDSTTDLVQKYNIQQVFLAHVPTWQEHLVQSMSMRHPNVQVHVVPSYYEALLRVDQIDSHGDIGVVRIVTEAGKLTEIIKRVFDLFVAVTLLTVLSPIILISMILIRLTSSGPAIFAQERVGRFGTIFKVFKLRTMVEDAEARSGPVLADGSKDTRLTPIGRVLRLFRLDEVPQLWNVIRGEMSLVGPRPERPNFVHDFVSTNPTYAMRHQVRPGITGLAQVLGGYHTNWRDKLRFDLIYVSHQSVMLDITILFKTVAVVIFKRGHEKN